jgi:hypothetical protein
VATLNQGDHVHDQKFGSGRVIHTKKNNALVEFAKTAPNELLPGVWSIKHKMTITKHDGTKKRVPDDSSFGRPDACNWYDRYDNNLEVVLYPDKIKRDKKQVITQSIKGDNNIQVAGNVVVQTA